MESQFTISSVVFIVLLIVPGVFFKRFYFQGHFAKQFGAGLFADRIITSIFWGLLIQIITFVIFSNTFNFTFNTIRQPLSQVYGELSKDSIPDFSTSNLAYALAYLFASVFVAALLGTVLHRIVRFFKIDVKFQVFRFANQWHYYFKGDILSSNDFRNSRSGKVLSTSADVILDNGDGSSKMISGFLTQYTISAKTGELETIYLTAAQRFSQTSRSFKDIPGDCLLIPYNRVIDLNLRYNFKAPTDQKRAIWRSSINILGLLGTLTILIYPWFLQLSAARLVVGITCAMVSWVMLLSILQSPSQAQAENKLNAGAIIVLIILFLIFALAALKILHLFDLNFNI